MQTNFNSPKLTPERVFEGEQRAMSSKQVFCACGINVQVIRATLDKGHKPRYMGWTAQ